MIDLGVNIDHVATLRQARGTPYPDPIRAALLAEQAGADLITLHLREDRRHIQDADVERLRPLLATRMNLESAVTEEMVDLACRIGPQDVCLVPERRQELTTEGGLDVAGRFDDVASAVARLVARGIRVSLFIDPNAEQVRASREAGCAAVELHTGAYAESAGAAQTTEIGRILSASELGVSLGMRVNAGHGLHYENVGPIAAIDTISELNIGHAIVAQAIFSGWERAVREMKALMIAARVAAVVAARRP